MRSQAEIAKRFEKKRKEFLNFETEVLIDYLDFDHAKPFLKPEVTAEQWKYDPSQERLMAKMREYMEFAIGKAEGHRGLSANRSVNKMCAWLFLLGDDDLLEFAEDDSHYPQYGAPVLRAIAAKYFPDLKHSDQFNRMADGLPCWDGCDEGCGA